MASIVLAISNTVITGIIELDDEGSFYQGRIERAARRQAFRGAAEPGRGLVMLKIDDLMRGDSSISNMLNGDAEKSLLTGPALLIVVLAMVVQALLLPDDFYVRLLILSLVMACVGPGDVCGRAVVER